MDAQSIPFLIATILRKIQVAVFRFTYWYTHTSHIIHAQSFFFCVAEIQQPLQVDVYRYINIIYTCIRTYTIASPGCTERSFSAVANQRHPEVAAYIHTYYIHVHLRAHVCIIYAQSIRCCYSIYQIAVYSKGIHIYTHTHGRIIHAQSIRCSFELSPVAIRTYTSHVYIYTLIYTRTYEIRTEHFLLPFIQWSCCTYIHTCTYTYLLTYTLTYLHTHVRILYAQSIFSLVAAIQQCLQVAVYIHIHLMYTCMYIYSDLQTSTDAYTNVYVYIHILKTYFEDIHRCTYRFICLYTYLEDIHRCTYRSMYTCIHSIHVYMYTNISIHVYMYT